VLAPALFPTPDALEQYYDAFLTSFYEAKELARIYGISLNSNAVGTLSMIRDRTCQGKIVLTPVGSVSCCARVSSPQEKLYDDYIFGFATEDSLQFDEPKLQDIMSEYNIYTLPKCRDCFAKWNCGGGCRLFHQAFPEEFDEVRCRFARKALRRELLSLLSKQFATSTGRSLDSYVREKMH
jgi:radical SAM protein with 4Fe4S-binding SPASM domain